MPGPRTAVVIPCFNTSAVAVDVVRRARAWADAVLAVDDGSTDDTAAQLRRAGSATLHLPTNQGKGAALRVGILEVLRGRSGLLRDDFDLIVTLDGDGQHDPADIPRFVECASRRDADLVLGTRDVAAMPPKSRFGNNTARLFFYLGTGRRIADAQCGFRLFSRTLAAVLLPAVSWRRYETEAEILFRAVGLGARIETVVIPTVYFDGNRGTHFEPFADSMRVFAVLSRYAAVAAGRRFVGRSPAGRESRLEWNGPLDRC